MAPRIKIQNFGPIKTGCGETSGWCDLARITLFVGNQGSGKSTVAKLISAFTWLEKSLFRGDFTKETFINENLFQKQILPYHKLENYLSAETTLGYEGGFCSFCYANEKWDIQEKKTPDYQLPQLIYTPAERNLAACLGDTGELKQTSEAVKEFVAALDNAKREIKQNLALPIDQTTIEYDPTANQLYLRGTDFRIKISESASGYQSYAPLYLVAWHLSNQTALANASQNGESMSMEERWRFKKGVSEIYANPDLTPEQRQLAISSLSKRFKKTAFINIVEEPEQNLFPSSQLKMLESLAAFANKNTGNKLVVTTHSPYLVGFLNILIQGFLLKSKIEQNKEPALLEKLSQKVSLAALLPPEDVAIYQLDEKTGAIAKLPNYNGILSDDNFLNNKLRDGNELFDSLLEIEEELVQK
jgi:predicted ATPase